MRTTLASALLVVLAAACGPEPDRFDTTLTVTGPLVAGERLVWVNHATARVIAVDPAAPEAAAHVSVVSTPRAVATAFDSVLVLGGEGHEPRLDRVALPGLERTTLELPVSYDRVAVSPDGAFAVLTFDPNAPLPRGSVPARNNNEIGVVTLPELVLTRALLQTEALAPLGIVFSDQGNLAAVLLESAVALVDLESPDTAHVRVPLKLSDGRVLTPLEATFSPDAAFLYVRASGTSDVLALEVLRSGGALDAALNFLFVPGATALGSILVPPAPGLERSIAATFQTSSGPLAALLDATGDTSLTRIARLGRPLTRLAALDGERLLVYADPAPGGGFSRFVAGWNPQTGHLDEDTLPGTYRRLPLVAGAAAFFQHDTVVIEGQESPAAVTGVRFTEDSVRLRVRMSPVVLAGAPSASAVDPATGRLLLSVEVPRFDSGATPRSQSDSGWQVGFLFVLDGSGRPEAGLPLDASVTGLAVLGGRAVAFHPGRLGDMTVVPLTDLRREAAVRHQGFLLSGAAGAEEAP